MLQDDFELDKVPTVSIFETDVRSRVKKKNPKRQKKALGLFTKWVLIKIISL